MPDGSKKQPAKRSPRRVDPAPMVEIPKPKKKAAPTTKPRTARKVAQPTKTAPPAQPSAIIRDTPRESSPATQTDREPLQDVPPTAETLERSTVWTDRPTKPPLPPARPMVQAIKVARVYRTGAHEVTALDSVDIELQRGEMVAVMGPSGCGKTTLLNCLSGLDQISSGRIFIEGEALAEMSDSQRTIYRARRMGFVFQAFNLLPIFTAVENVELPLLLSGTRRSKARKRAREALDSVGLADRAKHRPAELSAGEQQRVAIARAIAPDPAVLWADEPTGNLDSDNAERVIQLLKKMNVERHLTVLMVTHDEQVAGWAEHIIVMRDGRIVGRRVPR